MFRFTRRRVLTGILALSCGQVWSAPRAEHVFIISFDGGKPSVMQRSSMPTLFSMAKQGAVTWEARTTVPSVTLPSHTSMLTGVSPIRHRVLWNDYKPQRGLVKVPTVFTLAKRNGFSTAMFVNKEKFKHLNLPGTLDRFDHAGYTAKQAAASAASYIVSHRPNLCFIHFADPDSAGHKYGWGSSEQVRSFKDTDDALRTIMNAIRKAGIAQRSVVIMSADHGGHGKSHGSLSPEDMIIPWIAWGAGVKRGHQITAPVTTYDSAATALWLLGVPIPGNWTGRPVTSAFTPLAVNNPAG